MRRRHHSDAKTTTMLAAVASESLPYTDPRAGYPTARAYRSTRESVAAQAVGTRQADGDAAADEM